LGITQQKQGEMKTTCERESMIEKGTDRTETGQKNRTVKRLPKTHQDFWASRLRKRTYKSNGETFEVPDYQVRMFHLGREEWFNLQTSNKAAAAAKARDIYLSLVSAGWEATRAKFKPDMEVSADGITIGEYLLKARAVATTDPVTFATYARKFRTVVSEVFGINGGDKHNYRTGGYKEWADKVEAIRLERLTPELVNKWMVERLEAAQGNPMKEKQSKVTVKSILRNSASLFSKKKILKHLKGVKLPSPLPFEDVTAPTVGVSRYKSQINPALILKQANEELAETEPELFKIILLAFGLGLRRDEIDTLEWKQIQWHRNAIVIETTEHTGTKSSDSEADVDADPALLEILKGYMPKAGQGTPFVINSPVAPRPSASTYHHYRCTKLFKAAVKWLRSKGVKAQKPLHTLRKEFGSQIAKQAGIYAASHALRHASISLTRDYYVDKKETTVIDINKFLGGVS
jgi:integrase